jgi:hypothetical protein
MASRRIEDTEEQKKIKVEKNRDRARKGRKEGIAEIN